MGVGGEGEWVGREWGRGGGWGWRGGLGVEGGVAGRCSLDVVTLSLTLFG